MIKSRRMKWARHVARRGQARHEYRTLVGKPGGKIKLENRRLIWNGDIKADLQEICWGGRVVDWVGLAEDNDE
jgi:hypothetical protein